MRVRTIGDRLIDLMIEQTVFATTGMPGAELSMLNQGDAIWISRSTYKEMNDTFGKVDGALSSRRE